METVMQAAKPLTTLRRTTYILGFSLLFNLVACIFATESPNEDTKISHFFVFLFLSKNFMAAQPTLIDSTWRKQGLAY
jgi:hypothetical protein